MLQTRLDAGCEIRWSWRRRPATVSREWCLSPCLPSRGSRVRVPFPAPTRYDSVLCVPVVSCIQSLRVFGPGVVGSNPVGGTTSSVLELTPRRFRAVHGQCVQSWGNPVIREHSAPFPVLSPMAFCFTFSRESGSGDPSAVAAELPRKPRWSCRTRWPRNMGEDAGPGAQARDLKGWQARPHNLH